MSKKTEYTFFSSAHFLEYIMLGHKSQSVYEDQNHTKQLFQPQQYEIRYQLQEKVEETNTCKLNNMLLNSQWASKEIKREIR